MQMLVLVCGAAVFTSLRPTSGTGPLQWVKTGWQSRFLDLMLAAGIPAHCNAWDAKPRRGNVWICISIVCKFPIQQ